MKSKFVPHLCAALLVLAGRPCLGGEFVPSEHYAVMIHACDATRHCDWFRRPVDADNEVHCQMTAGMQASINWALEHKSLTVTEWRCAKPDEAYL